MKALVMEQLVFCSRFFFFILERLRNPLPIDHSVEIRHGDRVKIEYECMLITNAFEQLDFLWLNGAIEPVKERQ